MQALLVELWYMSDMAQSLVSVDEAGRFFTRNVLNTDDSEHPIDFDVFSWHGVWPLQLVGYRCTCVCFRKARRTPGVSDRLKSLTLKRAKIALSKRKWYMRATKLPFDAKLCNRKIKLCVEDGQMSEIRIRLGRKQKLRHRSRKANAD